MCKITVYEDNCYNKEFDRNNFLFQLSIVFLTTMTHLSKFM